jgi:hypothetical protein
VRGQQRFGFRTTVGLTVLSALFLFLAGASSWGQAGSFLDQGGAVFNVKAYGATGNGSTDDTANIQRAIDAALAAGGGIVYFPAGKYLLKEALSSRRMDLVSLVGSGTGTNLIVSGNLGISLSSTGDFLGGSHGYHSGRIQGMHISCGKQSESIAVQMTDMIAAPQLMDLTVSRCNQAFDLINQKFWTERLVATNVTDDHNNHLFHLDQNPNNANNSYGYAIYNGIFLDKGPGQDAFYLTGGAYLYSSKLVIKGNFALNATGASVFNVQGGAGEPCSAGGYNAVDVAVEGGGYSIVKASSNGCKGGPWGSALFHGTGPIIAMGKPVADTNNYISDSSRTSLLAGTFTASSSTSDSVSARAAVPTSACYVQPTNAIAAEAMSGTYVSSASWGTVKVVHPSKATGGTFQVWCTAQ